MLSFVIGTATKKSEGPLIPFLPSLSTLSVDSVMSLWMHGNPGVHEPLKELVCGKKKGQEQGRLLFNLKRDGGTSTQNTCRYIRLIAIAVELLCGVMSTAEMDRALREKNMSLNRFAKELSSTYKHLGYVTKNEPLTTGEHSH